MRRVAVGVVVFALSALALAAGANAAGVWSSDARVLAYDDHSSNVGRYERALSRVWPKCRESRHKVAVEVFNTKRVLRHDGYRYSNLSLLRGLYAAIPWSVAPTRCAGVLAALVVVLEKG
jgi:hypothetical protein